MFEMNLSLAILLFLVGIGLVLFFSEKLVEATVGTSLNFGISTFLISVIFIGFDPENLAVGTVAAFDGVAGIALGTVFGSAMVAIALAFGITALVAPMEFEETPSQILYIPALAVLLLGGCMLDGTLSRLDGALLIAGYIISIIFLIYLSLKGLDIQPSSELEESLEDAEEFSRAQAVGLLALSLAAIILGSELLVSGADYMLDYWNLSETVYGMTILALLISFEELARELPAALKGRPEIAVGNVIGSILAFFLFNAGIIALVHPIAVGGMVNTFYLPVCLGTVIFVSTLVANNKIPRWAGAVLFATYLLFFIRGFY